MDRSGVRGGVKTQKKSSKRDARQRRKELDESRDDREDGRFIFFDEPASDFDVSDLGQDEGEDEGESPRRRVSLGIRKNKSDESENNDEEKETSSTVDNAYVASDAPAPPKAEDSTHAANSSIVSDAPPPGAADAIDREPTSTELLARLQDHLPDPVEDEIPSTSVSSNVTSSTMPSLDTKFDPTFDPFGLPADPTNAPEVAEQDEFDSFDSFGSFDSDTDDGFVATTDDFGAPDSDFDFEESSPPPPAPNPAQTESERPSLLDRLSNDPGVAVSRVAPISEADHLAAEEDWNLPDEGPQTQSDYPADDPIATDPLAEAEIFEPVNYDAPATGGKGEDTDDEGNWIPPALRGMAPVEEREALSLPKRRD